MPPKPAFSSVVDSDVLVIGRGAAFRELASRLRMSGRSTWLAATNLDVHWLLQSARIRPSLVVVELPAGVAEQTELVRDLLQHRRLAHVPVVLVGGELGPASGLPNTCAALPPGATAEEIERALPRR